MFGASAPPKKAPEEAYRKACTIPDHRLLGNRSRCGDERAMFCARIRELLRAIGVKEGTVRVDVEPALDARRLFPIVDEVGFAFAVVVMVLRPDKFIRALGELRL